MPLKRKKTWKTPYQAPTDAEIDELIGAAFHHESIFHAVLAHVIPLLGEIDGSRNYLLDALRHAAPGGGPGSPEFWARVRGTLKKRAEELLLEEDELGETLDWLKECRAKGEGQCSEALARSTLPRYVTSLQVGRLSYQLVTQSLLPTAAELADFAGRLASISDPAATARLSDLRAGFDTRIEAYWGRDLMGLTTGVAELDRRTDGLRGLTLFGAKPGSGKTTKALELALGVARHDEENDAAVVIVSADMPRETLYARMLCNLGGVEYARLAKGSPVSEKRAKGWKHHSKADVKKIKAARAALDDLQDRLFLYGSDNGQPITAANLKNYVTEAKKQAKRSRAFLVVDYLQLLAVPDGMDEMAADRHRVAELQRVIEAGRRQGDDAAAVLAISEMRKPVGERKGKDWGTGIEDLMGTARLGYAADAALLCRAMTAAEMAAYYPGLGGPKGKPDEEVADKKRAELAGQGIAPVMFALAKGRDGTRRGKWGEAFHYNVSRFEFLPAGEHLLPSGGEE